MLKFLMLDKPLNVYQSIHHKVVQQLLAKCRLPIISLNTYYTVIAPLLERA